MDDPTELRGAYLGLLKLCLVGLTVPHPSLAVWQHGGELQMGPRDLSDEESKLAPGPGWPVEGFTMIGLRRLENLQACVEDSIRDDVPGDLIETGVWRGGATIFMRALLKVHSVRDRMVFVADSFQGLPPPEETYPFDTGSLLHTIDFLSVSLDDVKSHFETFGLLDDQVRFVKGWFRDTLPTLSDRKWAVIRLDGDLYESTINALENLYPHLSVGGYAIVDDYGISPPCRNAVDAYRKEHGLREELRSIDFSCVFWQKTE